jgi:phosphate-selective porin OprO and OprP
MRSLRSWAPALVASVGLSFHAPLLFAQSTDDDLRKEIQQLRDKLEQLEKKLEQKTESATPQAAAPTAAPSAQDEALQHKVEELDQQVRILGRKQELDAEEKAAEKKERVTTTANERGVSIKSGDGNYDLRLRGVVQTDGRFFLGDSIGTDTFLLRKVRPTIEGTFADIYDFRIMPDFGGGKAVVQEAYAAARFRPWAKVTVGKMKEPIGLERLQLDADTRLVERAFPTDIAPNRDIGVDLHGDLYGGLLEYDTGIFNGALDGGSSEAFTGEQDNNSDKEWAARIFARPFRNNPSLFQGLGLGIAVGYQNAGGSSPASGTATAQQTNLPSYVTPAQLTFFTYRTTGPSATFSNGERFRWSPQGYWYYGPFGLMAEYIAVEQDVGRNVTPTSFRKARLTNNAWQVQASYMLTGEDETFGGIRPYRDFGLGKEGWGAFELVGRYSALTIDDAAFEGGTRSFADITTSARSAKEWSAGLNWYLNWNVKLQFDYSRTRFDGGGGGTLAAPIDRPDEQLIFGRVQLAF